MFLPRLSDAGLRKAINGKSTAGWPSITVEKHAHPTVLVAIEDNDRRSTLVFRLRQLGCLVLEADRIERAIEVIISHSRPIQVLLADKNLDDLGSMEKLKRYRPQMHVLLITGDLNSGPDALAIDSALDKTRELLDLSKSRAAAT